MAAEPRRAAPNFEWDPDMTMKRRFLLCLLPIVPGCGAPADTQRRAESMDVAQIATVVVSGDSSRLALSTDPGRPFVAEVSGRRSGWLSGWMSSWFLDDCRSTGRMSIEGSKLLLDVVEPFGLSDCEVEFRANLPQDVAVSVDQKAVMAALDGEFSSVTIAGHAADISLDGHAGRISLSGEAMRARLDFETVLRDEQIDIDARALDASLSFGKNVPISYSIEASASFVDSALADTPGAKPVVRIKGDFVRATIR